MGPKVALHLRQSLLAATGDECDDRSPPAQQFQERHEHWHFISPGRHIGDKDVAVMRLQPRVMTTVDPSGWDHSDNGSAERGLGHHLTEQSEEARLCATGNDHRSRHPGQFDDRSAQGRLDPGRVPSSVTGGAAIDNKCPGVVGERNLRNDSLNRLWMRRNVDSKGKRFRSSRIQRLTHHTSIGGQRAG